MFQPKTAKSNAIMEPIEVAISAAKQAASIIQQFRDKGFKINHKGINDLVTEADVASEQSIIETIKSAFPSHKILAEESTGVQDLTDEPTWIIDPIDGTTNFAHDFPAFCVSIAFWEKKEPQSAVVLEVSRNELFTAVKGKGAKLNGKLIQVSKIAEAKNALLATGFPYKGLDMLDDYLKLFKFFLYETHGVRRPGSAAYDLCCLAAGRVEAFYEYGLSPWDVAAGALIVQEAGGKVTDWNGMNDWLFGKRIIASNGLMHNYVQETIKVFMG